MFALWFMPTLCGIKVNGYQNGIEGDSQFASACSVVAPFGERSSSRTLNANCSVTSPVRYQLEVGKHV